MSNYRFSDEDIEILISGDTPEDERLARLVSLVEKLHDEYQQAPSDERVAQIAAAAAEIAISIEPDGAVQPVPMRTMSRSKRFAVGLRRRMATALAAAVLLSGMTGVAVASDGAAPGDTLYGVDQALESIGIADGGIQERFAEAGVLNERGEASQALSHAAEAIAQAGGSDVDIEQAVEGLNGAIAALNQDNPGDADAIREHVAGMLGWMQGDGAAMLSDPKAGPGAFGKAIADMARGVSTEDDAADAAEDAAENAADAAKDAAEGEDGEPGPPDGIPGGPPDNIPPTRP